jgi:hypothetical protein
MKAVFKALAGMAVTVAAMSTASAGVLEGVQVVLPTGTVSDISYLDFSGKSFVANTYSSGSPAFTFTENGVFNITGNSGGGSLGIGNGQLTADYRGGTGTGSLTNGTITFNAGGTLDIYYNPTQTFDKAGATVANRNGAASGIKIASFTQLAGGSGQILLNGAPDSNGQLTLLFKSTFFADGVWLDSSGHDLMEGITIGFVTANASEDISNLSARYRETLSGSPTTQNDTSTGPTDPLTHFFVKNGGQLTLEAGEVPEPASLAIFGAGLLGLAALRRRKS